ncbi:MAG: hypothetical protein N4Q30_03815 [Neisseriaceae bacterium]|nr:hypothetical protein [Neisseriaceae bacterium]
MKNLSRHQETEGVIIRKTEVEEAIKLPEIESSAGKIFASLDDLSWVSDNGVQSIEKHCLSSINKLIGLL